MERKLEQSPELTGLIYISPLFKFKNVQVLFIGNFY